MRTIGILGVLGLAVCAALASAAEAPSTMPSTAPTELATTPPPDAPLPPGVTRIFDGMTLEGWKQVPADSWVAKNGVLASRGVGRGVIYTAKSFGRYRIVFDMRHVYGGVGKNDHRACVLVFCTAPQNEDEQPLDALAGIQFQPPNGGSWDYRKGHNNGGKGLFTRPEHPRFDEHQWSRVEILLDPATGTARMAVAQPPGGRAVEVLDFKDPAAGRAGPFALQMHNKGLFDEYANIAVEEDPKQDELVTTKSMETPSSSR